MDLDVPALHGARILVVEDDAALRAVLSRGLGVHGSLVQAVGDGASAMSAVGEREFDAHIIDIGLPDADGRDVCQALRTRSVSVPVVFLTAMGAIDDLISGFAAGADDYIAKPFEFPELLVRLDNLLRRHGSFAKPDNTQAVLDPLTHSVQVADRSAPLTPTEFRILAALMAADGAVVRRGELIRAAWSGGAMVQENTLDQYVARVRRKLSALTHEHAIVTSHGVGYSYQ